VKAIPPIATDVTVARSICLSICLSVTFVHPAKAAGWNEMSVDRDIRVTFSNTVLDRVSGLRGKGRFG